MFLTFCQMISQRRSDATDAERNSNVGFFFQHLSKDLHLPFQSRGHGRTCIVGLIELDQCSFLNWRDQAHDLKVIGSNPIPATIEKPTALCSGGFSIEGEARR